MTPVIRRATAADAEAIARVHTRSWQHAYRNVLPGEWLDSLKWQDRKERWDLILSQNPSPVVYVALNEENQVVGFSSTGTSRDEDVDSQQTYELYAIYLVPETWGTGISAPLLQRLLGEIPEQFTSISLWVLADNLRGRKFYEKQGFVPDGATKTAQIDIFQLEEVRYQKALGPR